MALFAAASAAVLRRAGPSGLPGVASALGLAALLLHSWVDYPLRTASLATVAGVLAAILVARAAHVRARRASLVVGESRDGRHTS